MNVNHEQIAYVRDFTLYLTERINHDTHDFEELQGLSKQELQVLLAVAARNSMMVKVISTSCYNLSLSSLTRSLNGLENKGAIVRKLNKRDRRSFIVEITPIGQKMVNRFHEAIEKLAELMLKGLTSAERMMLIELYAKMWATFEETPVEVVA